MYNFYVRVCLIFRGNWISLSCDEIEFDIIIYVCYNWISDE
jgi:hypothetical protein